MTFGVCDSFLLVSDSNSFQTPLNKRILHAKQKEQIIFILQSVLNIVVVVQERHSDHYHVLRKASARIVIKSCYLKLK